MTQSNDLFTPGEQMQHQALVKYALMDTAKVPLMMFYCALQVLALVAVTVIEWEIIYEVFVYLSGDGEGYWTPELMGCSAAIMIIGFHLLAKHHPQNIAVQIVEGAVQLLIPVYLIGIGVLIAAIIYADGISGMVSSLPELTLGGLPERAEASWVEVFFSDIANPGSALIFSLGIGGLAIINIFVAHRLLSLITQNFSDISGRITRSKQALKDHALIKKAQKNYAALSIQLEELESRNDAYIRAMIANDTIAAIGEALHPHKVWLSKQNLDKSSRFEEQERTDISKISKEVSRIEAISLADVLAALTPKCLEKKS